MSHRERAFMALAHSISSLCFTGICTAPNDFGAVVSAGKKDGTERSDAWNDVDLGVVSKAAGESDL